MELFIVLRISQCRQLIFDTGLTSDRAVPADNIYHMPAHFEDVGKPPCVSLPGSLGAREVTAAVAGASLQRRAVGRQVGKGSDWAPWGLSFWIQPAGSGDRFPDCFSLPGI